MKKKVLIKYGIILLSVGILIALDLITKILFDNVNINIIGDFFVFKSTKNFGAGLGFLSGETTLLIIVSSLFLVAFIVFDIFYKTKSKLYFVAFNFIIAGAIGNLIDRIFLGYVRDFIYINLPFMPYYFNLADVFLTVGVVLLLIVILFKKEPKKEKLVEAKDEKIEGNNNGKEINN